MLQPLVMGTAVKVHPLAVVLAVAAGGFIAGIPGALFAVPVVAVLNVMVDYIARGEWRTQPASQREGRIPMTESATARCPTTTTDRRALTAVRRADPRRFEEARVRVAAWSRASRRWRARASCPSCSARRCYLKCENLQRTGSYKIRGAYNRLSQLTAEERARGVVAASAGNHAQGVAFAARELGIAATIFMPLGVALPKLQATRGYGADVVLRGHTVDEPLRAAAEFAERTGAVLIPPFDHPDIIAGQGTLGLEILDQVPEVDTVVVPIGGGGLISGVASALKRSRAPRAARVRVIGVQAENAAAYPPSLAQGEPTEITIRPTIADGIAVAQARAR